MLGFFVDRLVDFGDATALIDDDGRIISYATLAADVDAMAKRLGSTPRLVLVETRCNVSSVVAYLGALRGRHPVLLTSGPAADALRRHYSPAVIVDGDGVVRDTGAAPVDLHPDLALLLSTSGSTGGAKLVRLSRSNIEAANTAVVAALGISAADRAITTLPMGFSYGLSVIHTYLSVGASLILTDKSVIDDGFWALVEDHGATSLAGVPFTFELLQQIGFRDRDYPGLTTLTTSGARLPLDLSRDYAAWAAENGKRLFLMYGQTEAMGRIAVLPADLAETWPGCIGGPIPGSTLRVDPVNGELVFSGPTVMMGYATEPADLALGAEFTELRTGDIGELAGPGVFRITGRGSRFSKIVGLRIGHDDLEQQLARAGIAAFVAGDDSLIAVTGAAPADTDRAAELVRTLSKLPARVIVGVALATVPRMASGKPDLAAILAAGHAAQEAARPAVAADFAAMFSELLGRPTRADQSFSMLAGDSLSYVDTAVEVEARLGTLPANWEELTAAQLDALAAAAVPTVAKPRTRTVPGDMLVRCAAILGVLLNHSMPLQELSVAGGALTLMMLAGFTLARVQRAQLIGPDRWGIVGRFAQRLLIPYYIVVALQTPFSNRVDPSWWQLLPIGNLLHVQRGPLMTLWFIEVLLQLTVAMVLLFSVPGVRRAANSDRWSFAVLLFAGTLAVQLCFQLVLPEHPLIPGNLWRPDGWAVVIALGWAVAEARTTPQRLLCLVPAILFPALTWGWTSSYAIWLPLGTAFVLFVPRVSLWTAAARAAAIAASASYFIYLTHRMTMFAVWHVVGKDHHLLPIVASVLAGIAAWYGWAALLRALPRLWSGRWRVPMAADPVLP